MIAPTTLALPPEERGVQRSKASSGPEWWSARLFVVALVAALPLLLWFGRHHWFFLDEWWGLSRAGSSNPGYLDGHNGHWHTLTRIQYALTFKFWGLHSYVPYQIPVVLAHLGSAALVRQVSRRCGVRSWIATAIAVVFVFFGSGHENILWGWQSNMTGSLALGLALFLLIDGPRAVTRRDWFAVGVAMVGLMTSSAFMGVVAGFGIAILVRRGVRVAVFYTIPLVAIYLAWYLRYGSEGGEPLRFTGRTVWFVGRMLWAVFEALGQGPGTGALLAVMTLLGLGGALCKSARSRVWDEAALPVGLAAGWAAFAAMTAVARADSALTANAYGDTRYVHF
jgi:hypothetical protein